MYISFTLEVPRKFIREMFPIKVVCCCIHLTVFQINPIGTYNSEEDVTIHTQHLFFMSRAQSIDIFPQIIKIPFLDLYL